MGTEGNPNPCPPEAPFFYIMKEGTLTLKKCVINCNVVNHPYFDSNGECKKELSGKKSLYGLLIDECGKYNDVNGICSKPLRCKNSDQVEEDLNNKKYKIIDSECTIVDPSSPSNCHFTTSIGECVEKCPKGLNFIDNSECKDKCNNYYIISPLPHTLNINYFFIK